MARKMTRYNRRSYRRNPLGGKSLVWTGAIAGITYVAAKALQEGGLDTGAEESNQILRYVAAHPVITAMGIAGLMLVYNIQPGK